MANVVFNRAYDMSPTSGSSALLSASASSFVYRNPAVAAESYRFFGNFNVQNGYLVDGTVTRVEIASTTVAIDITGLSADATLVWDAGELGTWELAWAEILNGNDNVTGSIGDDVMLAYGGNDSLDGGTGRDELIGGAGSDTLRGGLGKDIFAGGNGDDFYYVDQRLESITEITGGGDDSVSASVNFTLAPFLEYLVLTGTAVSGTGNDRDNELVGNGVGNVLSGRDGHDLLRGQGGADTMIGGNGDDRYVVNGAADVVTELSGEGVDVVQASITYTLAGNVENLELTGSSALDGTGNKLNNRMIGNGGNNALDGQTGDDELRGEGGADVLVGWIGADLLQGGVGNDTLHGDEGPSQTLPEPFELVTATHEAVTGLASNEFAEFGTVTDDAMALAEVILGESSGITLVSATYTGAKEASSVFSGVDFGGPGAFKLGQGILLTSGDGSPNLTNTSPGSTQNNHTPGDEVLDEVAEAAFEGGGETQDAVVLEIKFMATGGRVSLDLMFGSDEYPEFSNSSFVDISAVMIDGVNYALFDGEASQPLSVIDKNLAVGSFFDNQEGVLSIEYDGLSSVLRIVGDLDPSKIEHTIRIAIADTGDPALDSALFLSNLKVRDATFATGLGVLAVYDDRVNGDSGNDSLLGSLGRDTLNGGTDADTMRGEEDDDTYIVDHAGDTVIEVADEGHDAIRSSISYTIAPEVEELHLTGSAAVNATGDTGDNVLSGNGGANTLMGLAGNDTLTGRGGADILNGGANNDTASYAHAIGKVVVNLALAGVQDTRAGGMDTLISIENLIGGRGDDHLRGNSGNNRLDGGLGNDTLRGGLGNDTYVVDSPEDKPTELPGEGIDTVISSVSWVLETGQLDAAIENVTLVGTEDLDATGNAPNTAGSGDNHLIGNDGNNRLSGEHHEDTVVGGMDTLDGGVGDDTLNGGLGNDSLVGGEGSDVFVFDTGLAGGNIDTIVDFDVADDVIALGNIGDVFPSLASPQLPGEQYFSEIFVIGAAPGDANDYLYYDDVTGALYFDPDGSGLNPALQFAQLAAGLELAAANFALAG